MKGELLFSRDLPHDIDLGFLSFSPDGQRIAIGIVYGSWRFSLTQIWSISGKLLKTLPNNQWSPIFNPKHPILTTSQANTIYLWNQDGKELAKLTSHKDDILKISFSVDGNQMTSTSTDKTAKLWTWQGQEIATLTHDDVVKDVQFSPNNQLVVTGTENAKVNFWNLKGQKLYSIPGHQYRIFRVQFSPNGKMIATASNDNTIKLWNLAGDLLQTLNQNREIYTMNFSPNSKQLLVASDQNAAVLWNLDSDYLQVDQQQVFDSLFEKACNWLDDYLKNKPDGYSDRYLCNE